MSSTSPCHAHKIHSCCHPVEKPEGFSFLRLAERVSAVALTILAAHANFHLFALFLAAGVGIGIYQHFQSDESRTGKAAGASCSQGFLEQITGVKLPPLVCVGVNLAVTCVHLGHHTEIYVPVVALSIGARGGVFAGRAVERIWPQTRGFMAATA